jgi:serine protease Do
MYFRYIAIICLSTALAAPLIGQTPAPRGDAETRSFAFSIDGNGGYLGVQTVEVSTENYSKFGLDKVRGVAVEKVIEGSPAEKAGLQAGDVLLRVNNDEITSSRKLTRVIGEIAPDHTASITVLRGGSERNISVTLGKRPEPAIPAAMLGRLEGFRRVPMPPDGGSLEGLLSRPGATGEPMIWAFGGRRQIGVSANGLTKQLAEHFGVDGGVLVANVREDSPAAKAGLKAGDIIVEANGKPVTNENELVRQINEAKEGDVSITFIRDRNRQTVNVTPEEVKRTPGTFFEFPEAPQNPAAPGTFRMTRPGAFGFPRLVV